MKKVLSFLHKNGQFKIAIPVLLIGFILQGILIGKYLPKFLLVSKGLKNPDQLFFYELEYQVNLFQTLGSKGRALYAEMLSVDCLYAIVSATGFALLFAALVKKEKWYISLPLLLGVSDILENISQLLLIYLFPEITALEVLIASVFSSTKMILSIICVSLILWYIGRNIYNWLKQKSIGK